MVQKHLLILKNEKLENKKKIFIFIFFSSLYQVFYNFHTERYKKRIPPTLIGVLGHIFAVQRHYVSYADLLKIRYSPFDCLIMVGTEDRLVREANSYIIRKVSSS
jgi:hypothetical protein